MNDSGRMNIFETSEQLVEEEFVVFFIEGLIRFNDGSQICIHHFRDYVYIFEFLSRFGQNDSVNVDYIFMSKELQKSKFSECSFGKNFMLECFIYFFDGNQVLSGCVGFLVLSCNDDSVGSLSDYIRCTVTNINDFISAVDLKFLL